jgi:hypothetical protein
MQLSVDVGGAGEAALAAEAGEHTRIEVGTVKKARSAPALKTEKSDRGVIDGLYRKRDGRSFFPSYRAASFRKP